MRLKFFICIVACVFFSNSCNRTPSEKKSGNTVKNISLKDEIKNDIKPLKLSQIVDQIEYVRLETRKESLIGNIDKLIITDSAIFVGDFEGAKSIFCFNPDGKLNYKIHDVGKGSNEYAAIDNFTVNKKDEVTLYCSHSNKLIHYNNKGEYLKTIHTSINFSDFIDAGNGEYFTNCDYLFNKDRFYNAYLINRKGKVTNRFIPYSSNLNAGAIIMSPSNLVDVGNHKIHFKISMDNSIYVFENGNVKKDFVVDYGPYNFDDGLKKMLVQKESNQYTIEEYKTEHGICDLIHFMEGSGHFLFLTRRKSIWTCTIWDKKSDKFVSGNKDISNSANVSIIKNDIDGIPIQFFNCISGEFIYALIDPVELIGSKISMQKKIEVSVNDNPIILKMRLKKL